MSDLEYTVHRRKLNMWRKLSAIRRTIEKPTGHRDKLSVTLEYPALQFGE